MAPLGAASGAPLVAYVILSLYALLVCAFAASPSHREAARKALAQLWRPTPKPAGRARGESLDVKVRELIARERVRCVQHYARPFMHVFALAALASVLLPSPLSPLGDAGPGGDPLVASRGAQLLDLLWHLAMCMLFAAFPRLVTTRSIDLSYVAFSVWWAIRTLALFDQDDLLASAPVALAQRAILGLVVCNASCTCSCNLLLAAAECLARIWRDAPADAVAGELAPLRNRDYLTFLDLVGTLYVVAALIFFEKWVWAASRHLLEVKSSSKTEVTVLRLLSALCDAVVTLGSDLRIAARAPKLVNLLLQGGSARALEGSVFLDLMAETDQERFKQFLARAPDLPDTCIDPAPAQALNVHLRDSSGVGVLVQLFHSHFLDLNDKVGHLIGICEVGDTGGRLAEGGRCGGVGEIQANANAIDGKTSNGGGSNDSFSTRGGNDLDSEMSGVGDSVSVIFARNHSTELARMGGGVAGAGPLRGQTADLVAPLRSQGPESSVSRRQIQARELNVAFDTLRFTIQQHQSPTNVVDASLLERESLQQWVVEWPSSRAWMQDFVNAALRPVTAATWPARAGPPSGLSFHVSFRGSCTLPPDILGRPPVPVSGGPAGAPEPDPRRRSAAGSADGRGPPPRLSVSRVRLSRRRLRSPAASHVSSTFRSEGARPGAAGPRRVQANLIGSPATATAAAAEGGPAAAVAALSAGRRLEEARHSMSVVRI